MVRMVSVIDKLLHWAHNAASTLSLASDSRCRAAADAATRPRKSIILSILAEHRSNPMIYQNFQAFSDISKPVRAIADMAARAFAQPVPGLYGNAFLRAAMALCELIARGSQSSSPPLRYRRGQDRRSSYRR